MSKPKYYNVIIDRTDSFICPIEANSEEEALSKAEKISNPQDNNDPHYTETKVIGIDSLKEKD
tara:strand:+ start:191 stop:379 length:189 start_codon:yes stop_codon:yes gene_type:complete